MKKRNGAMGRQMKLSELSRESEITPSTINYYVKVGVLHRPRKLGLNLHRYDETHLRRLRHIRQLKEKKGLSLAEIKQVLERRKPGSRSAVLAGRKGENGQPAEGSAREAEHGADRDERDNREKILDMAIQLFSERGYENTKISDITESLRMGRGTFYLYFKNKRELFIECIDRLGVAIVPRESWAEIREEKDFFPKTWKRGEAFLRAFPGYRGILNMVRGAIGGRDPVMAQKATEALRTLSKPMLKDLRRAIVNGSVWVKHDEALLTYLQLVVAEGFGYWQMIDPRYSVEEAMDIILDIFEHGAFHSSPSRQGPVSQQGPPGDVEHGKGTKTRVLDISVDGEFALRCRMDGAEVDVDLNKLVAARFREHGDCLRAELTTKDGQQLEIEVDADVCLTGMAPYGFIRFPLKQVLSISFVEG